MATPKAPLLFTKPADGYRGDPAREGLWCLTMATAVSAIVRNRGSSKAREDVGDAGTLADLAVAEYDKRVKYETLEEEQQRRDAAAAKFEGKA